MVNDKIEELRNIANRVNKLLTTYIDINDEIFKPSIRKIIPIPGIFKKINYHFNYSKLSDIETDLRTELNDLNTLVHVFKEFTIEFKFIGIFLKYCEALLDTIYSLKTICFKMREKIDGNSKYPYTEYDGDVEEYSKLVKRYVSMGSTVNQYYQEIISKT